jgi:hypothetical protein
LVTVGDDDGELDPVRLVGEPSEIQEKLAALSCRNAFGTQVIIGWKP